MFSIADIQTEDDLEGEHEGEEDEAPPATAMPIRASLSITKTSGPGAVNVDMICQEGSFSIENISYYDSAATGTELTAEADWNRRGLYIGPQVGFSCLIVGLQLTGSTFSLIPSTLPSKTHLTHSSLSAVSTTASRSSSPSTPPTRSSRYVIFISFLSSIPY